MANNGLQVFRQAVALIVDRAMDFFRDMIAQREEDLRRREIIRNQEKLATAMPGAAHIPTKPNSQTPIKDRLSMQQKIFTYPRSFLQLILLSYGLVTLPILTAAVYSAVTMNTLSRENSRAVMDASLSTHLSSDLSNRLTEMERGLRQYAVLEDPALLAEYRSNGEEFVQILKQFTKLHPIQNLDVPLYGLIDQAIRAIDQASDNKSETTQTNFQNAMNALEQLEGALPGMIRKIELDINTEITNNESLASSTQTSLLISLFLSVLVAAMIALMFRRLINRQMRQFERAVETLGAGHYVDEIHFSGPQDIRFLGEQLEWLRLRLKELEAQRHRFLRNVSHGLKTPLTVLREGSQLLAEGVSGSLGQQQQHIVNIMSENVSRLQRMIEDLLRAQQASLAVAGISPHAVRLDLICKQVLKDHKLQAEKKQISLRSDLPECLIEGVSDNLHKVVDNLLSNAIKFSPEGGEIKLWLQRQEDTLTLTISDEGPGIPEQERERVFEPFFRGAYTRTRGVEGSGVGLAISRDYVTAHGGKLCVLPSPHGACLEVRMPLRQNKPAPGDLVHA